MKIVLVSSYFDFNDYSSPVHRYLLDFNIYSFISSFSQLASYRVRRNQAMLSDSILLGAQGSTDEINFYSIKKDSYLIGELTDQILLQINFSLDVEINQYQRTVFSFLDLFGYIGGIFQIFKILGFIFAIYFASKSFYSSILSKLSTADNKMTKLKYGSNIFKNENLKMKEENKSCVALNIEQNSVAPSKRLDRKQLVTYI